jgi:ribosomal protein L16 Arg81 hydroxylase
MMQGQERILLEQAVWDDADSDGTNNVQDEGYEAHLEAGDGLFIPKGWWHSIKGIGEGVTASVSFIYLLFECSLL